MTPATLTILLTLVAYKLLLLGVGVWASRRVGSESDFFLASGQLGPWVAGLSYAASTSSAWVLLGFTGAVFTQGLVALWLVPGIFGGYVLTWFVLGPRLQTETAARGHVTIVDFLTADMTPALKRWTGRIAAGLILFCFVFYISSQFQAAGNALSDVFGLSVAEAVLIGAVVIVAYCLLGGFLAASVTDALQAAVMVIACLLVPAVTIAAAGGPGAIWQTLQATQDTNFFSFTGPSPGWLGAGAAMGLLGTGLGALGQPQLLNRIMAVRSARDRRLAAGITIGWGLMIYTGLVGLALAARALALDTGGEALFFTAARSYLPPVLAGIVVAAVLSAVMSTVDSLLLAAASAVSHDSGVVYRSDAQALRSGRLAMVAVAVVAVGLTLGLPRDIFSRVLFAWVALGAAFGPALLFRCLGVRVREGFVLAAIVTGFTLAVVAYNIPGTPADLVEKWLSWAAGLLILACGRQPAAEKIAAK